MNLADQLRHRDLSVKVCVQLESREHLASDDLLTRLRDQPLVEEDGRAWIANAAHRDFGFPEASLKVLPLLLVYRFDILASLHQSLEDEVLDEVGCRELCPAGVQGLEDLLSVLVRCQVDDNHLEQFPHGAFKGA